LEKLLTFIEDSIFTLLPTGLIFNQYRDNVEDIDLPGGNEIRRENLRRYIRHFASKPTTFLLGEAAGWQGCRFAGIPFTSEALLLLGIPIKGAPSSSRSVPYVEPSAKLFWHNLKNCSKDFFVWNTLCFHPYHEGNFLSNRTPTAREFAIHEDILVRLIEILEPERIGAIGKKAEVTLARIGATAPVTYVRHPAYGGKSEFERAIRTMFTSAA
jgi:hypothetical protein